jgi:hypothetical protein
MEPDDCGKSPKPQRWSAQPLEPSHGHGDGKNPAFTRALGDHVTAQINYFLKPSNLLNQPPKLCKPGPGAR